MSADMIVTIDGPAGAGKSTVARQLALRLGFRFLDTGAMYRAVALAAIRQQVPLEDTAAVAALARSLDIQLDDHQVLLNGEDVSHAIREPEVTSKTRYAADNVAVRAHLVELQRQAADQINIVTEGRDQGTVVFPDAECKFFLTASAEERARRRVSDLQARGKEVHYEEILAQQQQRDSRDEQRAVGPLRRADDAMEVITDRLSPQEVVNLLESLVRERQGSIQPVENGRSA